MSQQNDPSQPQFDKQLLNVSEQTTNMPDALAQTMQSLAGLIAKHAGVSQADIQKYIDTHLGGKSSPITAGYVSGWIARQK